LLERLEGRDYTKNVTIASEMIWRDSCRKPPSHLQ
jgi:LacI family transcriptional regulator